MKELEKTIESIESKLERLESDLGNIDSLFSKINYTLERLEKFLYEQDDSIPKLNLPDNTKYTENKKELYTKDMSFLKRLLERNSNPKTDKFLLSIINNQYETITSAQKAALDKISDSLNVK
jgi:hypothetical protein